MGASASKNGEDGTSLKRKSGHSNGRRLRSSVSFNGGGRIGKEEIGRWRNPSGPAEFFLDRSDSGRGAISFRSPAESMEGFHGLQGLLSPENLPAPSRRFSAQRSLSQLSSPLSSPLVAIGARDQPTAAGFATYSGPEIPEESLAAVPKEEEEEDDDDDDVGTPTFDPSILATVERALEGIAGGTATFTARDRDGFDDEDRFKDEDDGRGIAGHGIKDKRINGRGIAGHGIKDKRINGRGIDDNGIKDRGLDDDRDHGINDNRINGRGIDDNGIKDRGLDDDRDHGISASRINGCGIDDNGIKDRGLDDARDRGINNKRINGHGIDDNGIEDRRSDNKAVLYFTSMRGIRKTYDECMRARSILRGYGVLVDERDVWMHSRFKEELGGARVPQLFVRGRHVGGADEIRHLHESGSLWNLLEGLPPSPSTVCATCGGLRFFPCPVCNGSRKIVALASASAPAFASGDAVADPPALCPNCNENGLVLCPDCAS